jgi:hypothetical protein
MKYKLHKVLFIAFIPLFIILWIVVRRNVKKSARQNWETSFSGRVKDFDNGKIYSVTLQNDSTYQIFSYQLRSIIEIGDSLRKDGFSFRYILFKPNIRDSMVYTAETDFTK